MGGGYDERWHGADDNHDDDKDERHLDLTRGLRRDSGIPEDARRMGLDRNTVEGAMVGFTGSLDSSRRSHRIVAWVLLALVVAPNLIDLLKLL